MEGRDEIAASDLPRLHPELHHYTGLDGLRGIVGSKTLWATHFRHLNDSSEVIALRTPMIAELLKRPDICESAARHSNRRTRMGRSLNEYIGHEVSIFVDAMFDTAFHRTAATEPLAETYIFSLCAHSPDQSYEAQNGLLSQWRAYGRGERFCIVFDTAKLMGLLEQEFLSHSWVYLRLADTCYGSDSAIIRSLFPDLLDSWAGHIAARFRGIVEEISFDMIIAFLSAATRFKHQGFREEHEIRVIAIPHSQTMVELLTQPPEEMVRPIKVIRAREVETDKIPYIALFEAFNAELPIKRVIIGPSRDQQVNRSRALEILRKSVPLSCSETPYNG